MSERARQIIGEVLDHFRSPDRHLGDEWAFADDNSSMGLDHRSPDGTKFWLDLNRDGTIVILWKPPGSAPQTVTLLAPPQPEAEPRGGAMIERDVIEMVAKAIRVAVAKRVGSTATPWEGLFEYQREAYREEARAALEAISPPQPEAER